MRALETGERVGIRLPREIEGYSQATLRIPKAERESHHPLLQSARGRQPLT